MVQPECNKKLDIYINIWIISLYINQWLLVVVWVYLAEVMEEILRWLWLQLKVWNLISFFIFFIFIDPIDIAKMPLVQVIHWFLTSSSNFLPIFKLVNFNTWLNWERVRFSIQPVDPIWFLEHWKILTQKPKTLFFLKKKKEKDKYISPMSIAQQAKLNINNSIAHVTHTHIYIYILKFKTINY